MRVLGIDPGPVQTALVWYDGAQIMHHLVANEEALDRMLDSFPDLIAIEQVASYGMAVGATVFETCFWTGRFWQIAEQNCIRNIFLKRIDIKMHVCKDSRAKDSNIRQALIDRFGAPGTKREPGVTYGIAKDLWAALAVAVTAYDRETQ